MSLGAAAGGPAEGSIGDLVLNGKPWQMRYSEDGAPISLLSKLGPDAAAFHEEWKRQEKEEQVRAIFPTAPHSSSPPMLHAPSSVCCPRHLSVLQMQEKKQHVQDHVGSNSDTLPKLNNQPGGLPESPLVGAINAIVGTTVLRSRSRRSSLDHLSAQQMVQQFIAGGSEPVPSQSPRRQQSMKKQQVKDPDSCPDEGGLSPTRRLNNIPSSKLLLESSPLGEGALTSFEQLRNQVSKRPHVPKCLLI